MSSENGPLRNTAEAGALSSQQSALLTGAVQLGFVIGALGRAVFGLADRFDPRRLFAVAALIDGVANLAPLRDRYGARGGYLVGMKMAAAWTERRVGWLIGAVTLGSPLSCVLNPMSALDWHTTIWVSSVCNRNSSASLAADDKDPEFYSDKNYMDISIA